MGDVKLVRVVLEYSNGRKYVLEGEELETYMRYLDEGIEMLYIHGWVDMEEWNKLMRKVASAVGLREAGDEHR